LGLKAQLILLSVVHAPEHSGKEATEKAEMGAHRYLEGRAEHARSQGISVSTLVKPGIPAEQILSAATELKADMIAMATHRESVIARGILGSVTDAVLRNAEIPVLAINPDSARITQKSPSTVIVPLDGSKLSETAVPVALDIAEAAGARLIFIRTVYLPAFAVSGPGAEYYGVDYGISAERTAATEYLSQFAAQAETRGLKADVHAALGNAAGRILEDTGNVPDAMIVMCSHGRTGFKRMLLGSVADKVVRASHHPVLVLKNK
jgi:nucleotide-binding universal stress UspA family protein